MEFTQELIISTVCVGAASVATAMGLIQSWRYEHAIRCINRTTLYAARGKSLTQLPTVEKQYVICMGCGASVECGEDGFTPLYHSCFDPAAAINDPDYVAEEDVDAYYARVGAINLVQNRKAKRVAVPGDNGFAVYEDENGHVKIEENDRKIPIGLTGHLHTSKKPV